MQLDSNFTKINVEERTVYEGTWTDRHVVESTAFIAELDGISVKGEHIQMEREGATPDKAIKALFEAMTEADVTL